MIVGEDTLARILPKYTPERRLQEPCQILWMRS